MSGTTRRDILIAGLALGATGIRSARSASQKSFRVAIGGDYENLASRLDLWKGLGSDAEVVTFTEPFRSSQATIEALRDFDAVALMRERVPMPREVLERLPRLRFIVFSGLMDETLDHKAAAERGIVVCRSLGMLQTEAATRSSAGGGSPSEHALALMLACARHIPAADALVRRGGWAFQPNIPLRDKILGIVGYGRLGRPVARYGQALGMHVLGFSRGLTDEHARAEGIDRVDLEGLLRNSDVVSIHLPLTAQTKGLIGAREIGWMKPGVILVNTARAHIIDEQAVLEGLQTGKIGMAGFDVFWQEPVPPDHPLLRMSNVVMTPHVGYVTEPEMLARYRAMADTLIAYRHGVVKERYTPEAAAADERIGAN